MGSSGTSRTGPPISACRVLGIAKDKKSPPVPPTVATIADGSYPLADTITLHLHPEAPQSAQDFCKFASGPDAAAIVKQAGLWPEYDLKKGTIEVRMREVRAHRGIQIAISGSPAWEGLMKEIGQEFSKADTAVEVQYHAGGQVESVGTLRPRRRTGAAGFAAGRRHGREVRPAVAGTPAPPGADRLLRRRRGRAPEQSGLRAHLPPVARHPRRQAHQVGRLAETDAPEPFMRGEDDKAEGGTSLPSPPAAAGGNGGGRKMDGKARNAPHVEHKPAQPPKAKQDFGRSERSTSSGRRPKTPSTSRSRASCRSAEQAAVSRKPDAAKVLAAVARDPAAIGVIDLAKLPADDVSVSWRFRCRTASRFGPAAGRCRRGTCWRGRCSCMCRSVPAGRRRVLSS